MFTECHVLKHAWKVTSIVPTADGWKVLTLVCTRCGTERIDPVSPTGHVHRRRYRYIPGYLLAKGSERITIPEHRLTLLATQLAALKKGRRK